jgi:hypothetical protein
MLNNAVFIPQVYRDKLIPELRTDLQDGFIRFVIRAQNRYIPHRNPIVVAIYESIIETL